MLLNINTSSNLNLSQIAIPQIGQSVTVEFKTFLIDIKQKIYIQQLVGEIPWGSNIVIFTKWMKNGK